MIYLYTVEDSLRLARDMRKNISASQEFCLPTLHPTWRL
jgi:hypothetical protein